MAKCLLISMEFFPIIGGAGSNTTSLAKGLAGFGHAVDVLTYDFNHDCREFDSSLPYGVIRLKGGLPAGRTDWFTHAARLGWWLARKGHTYQCVLLADWMAEVLMNMASPFLRLPFATFVYGSEVNAFRDRPMLHRLTKDFYRRATAYLCISEYTRSLLLERFPDAARERAHIVPVAVEFPGLEEAHNRRDQVRQSLGLREQDFVLFQLSRVVDRKGHRQVIEALGSMSPEQLEGLVYVIGGSGPDSEALRELAAQLGLGDKVRLLGRVPTEELPGHYDACDLFIMPSLEARNRVEGFGAVYVEAALRGKPSIGSWHGAVPEVVLDGVTGLLADPMDTANLREKILRLRNDPALLERMGRAAEERAKSVFSLEQVSRRAASCLGLADG